jgi:hypothetical protein
MLRRADGILRAEPWAVWEGHWHRRLWQLLALIVVFGVLYGGVMGSYGGFARERILQVVYSALKVPFLLVATFMLSLPSFFVINTLFGLRADFSRAVRALLAAQAGLTVILSSLAPFTILWYVSYLDYNAAILFNALMFAVASIAAQMLLRTFYRPLIERNRRHLVLLRIWLVIYAFVGIQMGWVLRPFIGSPSIAPQFFRAEAWGNAYVRLAGIIWQFVGHGG